MPYYTFERLRDGERIVINLSFQEYDQFVKHSENDIVEIDGVEYKRVFDTFGFKVMSDSLKNGKIQ